MVLTDSVSSGGYLAYRQGIKGRQVEGKKGGREGDGKRGGE